MRGSAIHDFIGISWQVGDVVGVRLVGHGGTTNGQHSDFVMVPERDFAIAVLTNCGPNGAQLYHEVVKAPLMPNAAVAHRAPEPIEVGDAVLAQYAGQYETLAVT